MMLRSFGALLGGLALLLVFSGTAAADETGLKRYVDTNTQQLVARLNAEKGLYTTDPEAFYTSMNDALEDFVDFRRIAARVMGRYARQATPAQRDEFVDRFKRSLFDSYAKALVETDSFTISVKDAVIHEGNGHRASVQLEIVSGSGNRHPVTYSMYRKDNQTWMMENIIVEGINIGLAFRDRFSQEVEQQRGNIQAVIDGWTSEVVDTMDLDEQGAGS
ncbi:ABC transporter substrate-binding protein [Marinobacter sp. X15-166B]|uniref:MlaC/ttg2D family ABC transporter substrate-binding protein n=1 Tax=Marinobacter sp. X15-166B TaxID=1897620 RepID=UPI00114CF9B5